MSSLSSKLANPRGLVEEIQKMLRHFETFNFLQCKNTVQMGYNCENLKQNIHNEWLISSSITCDEPAFLSSSISTKLELNNTFNAVKSMVKTLPCSIVGSTVSTLSHNSSGAVTDCSDICKTINSYFQNESGAKLRKFLFCSPQTSTELFKKLQRDRLMWWKKFSASPGRFSLSQVFKKENSEHVEIQVEFPWGTAKVEKIKLMPSTSIQPLVKQNEEAMPHNVIMSDTTLEKAVLTFLCDSYEGMEDPQKNMLRFHRKLAPFKVSFAAVVSPETDERTLKDLALLLTKRIRKNLIPVLLLPDMCSASVDRQLSRNDALGVPYTVIIDENTLKTGILEIRSRDTTLREQSHVGVIVSYVEKLMKNY